MRFMADLNEVMRQESATVGTIASSYAQMCGDIAKNIYNCNATCVDSFG